MPGTEFLATELDRFARQGRLRSLRTVVGTQGRKLVIDGREVVNFSSNNYLGLADDPALREAVSEAVKEHGVGAGASRLISGNHDLHIELEKSLAGLHEAEAALLFNSGYQANLGAITSVVDRGDLVFSDELNHASIIDGCRLSRAKVVVYRHRDVADLEARLNTTEGRRKLIVSDSVFSMDGDLAPWPELSELATRHDAMLMVDEAHALGVVGAGGLATKLGVQPDITVATLGKAAGGFGAYVAGSTMLRTYLLNVARSFIFTTAPMLPNVAASLAAVRLLTNQTGNERREALYERIDQLRAILVDLELLAPGSGTTAIFPIVIGDNQKAMHCSARLWDQGLYVQGIRPPTVAPNTSRLRVALMATHTREDIAHLGDALAQLRKEGLL